MDLDLVEEFREKVGEELADVFLGLGVYYAENWMLDKAKEVLDWVERFREVEAKVLKFFMGFEDCEGYLKGLLRLNTLSQNVERYLGYVLAVKGKVDEVGLYRVDDLVRIFVKGYLNVEGFKNSWEIFNSVWVLNDFVLDRLGVADDFYLKSFSIILAEIGLFDKALKVVEKIDDPYWKSYVLTEIAECLVEIDVKILRKP